MHPYFDLMRPFQNYQLCQTFPRRAVLRSLQLQRFAKVRATCAGGSVIPLDWMRKRMVNDDGVREHLQETIDFPMKYGTFRLNKSRKPIH